MEGQKKVRLAILGTGNRARTYLEWIKANPDRVELVAAADIDPARLDDFIRSAGGTATPFSSADGMLTSATDIDALLICTPEGYHHSPAMKALSRGIHILLEKPLAPTLAECEEIAAEAESRGLVAGVSHVLRYHPYFMALRSAVTDSRMGVPVSVTHRVRVGIDRACHTFVRGPWGDATATSPVILSKCCHDVDLILWMLGDTATDVKSIGSLSWFRPENAPAGAGERCTACCVERECRFSAVDLYRRRKEWTASFRTPTPEEAIERELASGDYGRCVYRCGNNAPDRQTMIFGTKRRTVVSISMDFFTETDSRDTAITLTGGEITADGRSITIHRFGHEPQTIDFSSLDFGSHHCGADFALLDDFITAIARPGHKMRADIRTAIESHRVCLLAEADRNAES